MEVGNPSGETREAPSRFHPYCSLFFVLVSIISIVSYSLLSLSNPNPTSGSLLDIFKGASTGGDTQIRQADVEVVWATSPPSCAHIKQTVRTVRASKQRIWEAWNVSHFPSFLSMMHVPAQSWDLQKAKFVDLLLHSGDYRSGRRSFVVGFSGSSVTAGHDNYFEEAYPSVFRRAMLPAMRAAVTGQGEEEGAVAGGNDQTSSPPWFEVRNHALGNNPCYAYDACIAAHLGDDLDILTWEQSMNCGHHSKPLDTFSRSSSHMPKKPTIMYLLSGTPSWTAESCGGNHSRPRSSPLSRAEAALLQTDLRQVAASSGLMHTMAFLKDETASPGGGELLFDRFASLAPMGQSVFAAEQYKCQGPYSPDFATKTPGGGVSWHPGRLGHQLRGENLAYFLLAMLEDAAASLDRSVCGGAAPVQQQTIQHTASGGNTQLRAQPAPSLTMPCNESVAATVGKALAALGLDTPAVPAASTARTVASSAADQKLEDKAVIAASAVLTHSQAYLRSIQGRALPPVPPAYGLDETAAAPTCYTDMEPRLLHSLAAQVVSRYSTWTAGVSFLDQAALARAAGHHYGYLDRKVTHSSSGPGSRLALRIHVGATSPLWLCEVQKGFSKYPADRTDLPLGAEVSVLHHYREESANETWTGAAGQAPLDMTHFYKLELKLLSDQCYRTTASVPPGNHLLLVTQKGAQAVNLAYVVAW